MTRPEETFENIELNNITPEIDFSFSTILRIGFCFENADDNRRMNLHKERILELQTALTNLVPFMVDINRRTGEFTYRAEYQVAKDKEKKALKEYNKAWIKDKGGKSVFAPSMTMISAIDDLDEYCRIMAMKYKLYMRVDDERDTIPIARKPKIRW